MFARALAGTGKPTREPPGETPGDAVTNILGNGCDLYYDPMVDTALGINQYALSGGGTLALPGSGLAGLLAVRRRRAASRPARAMSTAA